MLVRLICISDNTRFTKAYLNKVYDREKCEYIYIKSKILGRLQELDDQGEFIYAMKYISSSFTHRNLVQMIFTTPIRLNDLSCQLFCPFFEITQHAIIYIIYTHSSHIYICIYTNLFKHFIHHPKNNILFYRHILRHKILSRIF